MNASMGEGRGEPPKPPGPRLRQGHLGNYSQKIPRIANKEIPLHNFGLTLDNFSLSKHHRCRSKVWNIHRSNQPKHSDATNKSSYNRPVHLLREYLERKEKFMVHPILASAQGNDTSEPKEKQRLKTPKQKQFFRTANEFRIKKANKKGLGVFPSFEDNENQEQMTASHLQKDREFTFYNKNLYDMSMEELQRSIEWKKSFLDLLNYKRRTGKAKRMNPQG